MSAVVLLAGSTYSTGRIFDDYVTKIWLNLLDDVRYVDCECMNCLCFICNDLRFNITPREEV